jgi:outer membrane protein assembly factor BamD
VIDRFPTSPFAEKAQLRLRECRSALAQHDADIARYYLRHGNLMAAESRLRGLLTEYPETEATAQALWDFARLYESRDEPEGATLALAAIVRNQPQGRLGREAREKLGGDAAATGDDPVVQLVARIDRMRAQEDRRKLPTTVSAYPEVGGVNSGY